jgi:zinc protease
MLKKVSFLNLLLLLWLAACATSASSQKASSFRLHPYQEVTLENGLRILLVPDQSLPRVSLGMMIEAGSLNEIPGKYGLASFTVSLLEEGTKKRSATQYADDLGQIASELGTSSGTEMLTISASSLSTQKEKLLELFSEAVLMPAFDKKEIERQRAQVLAYISREQDNPSSYAQELIEKVTFPNHAYGRNNIGDRKSVQSFTSNDLQGFYKKFYRPNNSILYVSGAFDDNFVTSVKQVFSAWQKSAVPVQSASKLEESSGGKIELFTKKDLKQSQIRFAEIGIRRSDPDYLALRLANIVLGGDFVSRLNQRVRDDLGLTYSIHSSSDAKLEGGVIEISTFTRDEKVGQTIHESREVIKKFIEGGVTADELAAAKALLAGQFPAAIETTDKLAYNLQILRRYGVSDSYLHDFVKNLNAITLNQVNAAIKKHIHAEDFKIVVYADQSKVLAQLQALGPVDVKVVKPE